ncbi:MAG: tRNA pseudouridine(38-40) synthase TruA [Ignavibacteriae bacterium]|nr:tRNA pseudouridine(38-40) synthase TruA [Ignavibacteriota bacterium]
MQNIKLTLEYDGTNFVGWQVQPNGRSVQAELERSLQQILQIQCKTNAAGRTDSGVHARGQIANFLVPKSVDVVQLLKSLNGVLPDDIVVLGAEHVAEEFHSRYSAKGRRYVYSIVQKPTAVLRNFAWHVGYVLDTEKLEHCASAIQGEHDFQSFCKVEADVEHYRCVVQSSEWKFVDSRLEFDVTANRFLHGMVRALVGTMIDVGRGYTSIEEFQEILAAKDRREAGMAAPAKGLCLEQVFY